MKISYENDHSQFHIKVRSTRNGLKLTFDKFNEENVIIGFAISVGNTPFSLEHGVKIHKLARV